MKKTAKIISYIIDILLVIAIIFVCYKIYLKNKYGSIENEYLDAAKFIYESNGISDTTKVQKIVITRSEINSLLTTPVLSKDCNGYVIIYPNKQGPTFEVFIKCGNKYKTKGFEPSLLN